MDYISCFSGIGGLEAGYAPKVFCDLSEGCRAVLRTRYPIAICHDDIKTLRPPRVEIVAGGWPCQDISIAGQQAGLRGDRSGLLSELLRVARESKAHTLIAENVTNLLRIGNGSEFTTALSMIHDAGFPYISWRVLNARAFGLPQHRNRLIIIASKAEERTLSLFRDTPALTAAETSLAKKNKAAGFYWTAGIHSINYSMGYVPTLKIGSGLQIPSPPAVHFDNTVRLLTPKEALMLQGFVDAFDQLTRSEMYLAAGNAVARPMGEWVFDGVTKGLLPHHLAKPSITEQDDIFNSLDPYEYSSSIASKVAILLAGQSVRGKRLARDLPRKAPLATNLVDFIDRKDTSLISSRAANGLLARLSRSGQFCPPNLKGLLIEIARNG